MKKIKFTFVVGMTIIKIKDKHIILIKLNFILVKELLIIVEKII